jgi:hypothetical protein
MQPEHLEGWSSNEFKPILDDSSSSSSSDSESDSDSDDEELKEPRGVSASAPHKFKKFVTEEELLPE